MRYEGFCCKKKERILSRVRRQQVFKYTDRFIAVLLGSRGRQRWKTFGDIIYKFCVRNWCNRVCVSCCYCMLTLLQTKETEYGIQFYFIGESRFCGKGWFEIRILMFMRDIYDQLKGHHWKVAWRILYLKPIIDCSMNRIPKSRKKDTYGWNKAVSLIFLLSKHVKNFFGVKSKSHLSILGFRKLLLRTIKFIHGIWNLKTLMLQVISSKIYPAFWSVYPLIQCHAPSRLLAPLLFENRGRRDTLLGHKISILGSFMPL